MKHKYTSTDLTEHQIQACVMEWMKRHGIVAIRDAESLKWGAQIAGPMSMTRFECDYDTIDEALASLGIPLWNEEQYKKEHKTTS